MPILSIFFGIIARMWHFQVRDKLSHGFVTKLGA